MKQWILFVFFYAGTCWGQIQVTSIEYGGAGCPPNSVRALLAPDGSAFSIFYDQYHTEVGNSVSQARQSCSVILHIIKPKNLGFRVEGADFRGFVSLEAGVVASQNVRVMAGPNRGHRMLSGEFASQVWNGPITEDFALRTVRPLTRKAKASECEPRKDRTDIVVESVVQINNGGNNKTGELTVDTADGAILQKFLLTWLDCSTGEEKIHGDRPNSEQDHDHRPDRGHRQEHGRH